MKIVLLGADGQLGSDFKKIIPAGDLISLTQQDIDVCNFKKTAEIIKSHSPEVVINTTAYNKVEESENNIEEAMKVNALAVKNLAYTCKKIDSVLVHFSTDYVFDGRKKSPYKEDDIPLPQQGYGVSKLAGEYFIKYICPKFFIIRTSGLYGKAGSVQKGGNFPSLMLHKARQNEEIKVVDDVKFSPTYTRDLAKTSFDLIKTTSFGLYHITNRGYCSWYTFAKRIFKLSKIQANIKPMKYHQLNSPVRRPKYSVLSNHNLKKTGIKLPRLWFRALDDYLREIGVIK